jgi:tetratricopeptide (TPR) repeat protein
VKRNLSNRRYTLALAAVLLVIAAAYANSFGNSFHFDDYHTVVDNPAVRTLNNVPRFFTDTTTFSVLPANRTYRPVVSTMLALDYALGHGYSLFWFHLSTFVLFCLLVGLLAGLYAGIFARAYPGLKPRLSQDPNAGAEAPAYLGLLAAAWFGMHPAMAETVNYVIQRGDLYCTLGCVAALYVYAQYPARRGWGLYLLPFALALLSKPPAAVFPVLLLLYVYFFENESESAGLRLRRAAIASVPSVVVTVALLWLQSAMTPKSYTPTILSAADYRLTQPYVWLRYTVALFLPVHLNVDTDLTAFAGLNLAAMAGIVFVLAMLAAIWFTARERRLYPIGYGLLWFVVTQLPTSLYPLSEVENDHRMFFSFVGLIAAVVWAGWLAWQKLVIPERWAAARPAVLAAVAVVLAAYGYGVHERNRVWHSEESLWLDDVQKSPANGRGLMNYALTQMSKGAYLVALDYFMRALQYTPNYATLEINLGIVNGAMADGGDSARAAEAERHFLRAISLAPSDDGPHAYYGRWLDQHGRTQEALRQLQTAVALNPSRVFQRDLLMETEAHAGDLDAARATARQTLAVAPDDAEAMGMLRGPAVQDATYWINLSLAQYRQALYPQSIESARKALALDTHSASAYNNIAAGYGAMQQWDEAIDNAQRALQLDPTLQIAKNNLAWYQQQRGLPAQVGGAQNGAKSAATLLDESLHLYQAGRFQECIAAAQGALKLQPNFPEAWNNIAAADASLHRWDDAIAAAQKAIALKPDFQLAKNNLAWALAEKAKK